MPYKTESIKIDCPFLDKRTKLLPCQKERVIFLRDTDNLSQRQLSKLFGVSRRLITFILDPNKKVEDLKRREERGGTKIYYNKEQNNTYMKNHRSRKYQILKDTI